MSHDHSSCPDCDGLSRRDFLKGAGTVAVAAATVSIPVFAVARAAAEPNGKAETLAQQFYNSLNDSQRSTVCFGWDHPRRLMVQNNWYIVPQKIGQFYTPEQQDLALQIFKASHSSDEWVQKRLKQLNDDAPPNGFKDYSLAMFGKPGTGQYEWVMTGRHLTMRVDGDSEPGVAFGGPIFYGHAAQGFNEKPDHPGNVYWYQAQRANQVFQAMDGKQRAKALVEGAIPPESGKTMMALPAEKRHGIHVSELSRDQQELVGKVLEDLLAPMRKSEMDEARKYIEKNGGVKSLNMSFYKAEDIGNDGVWDVWMLEGPSMVWYFRGAPHVHTWVYVGERGLTKPVATP